MRAIVIAAAVAAAAIGVPAAASGAPAEQLLPTSVGPHLATHTVEADSRGFDWEDAGIGAAGAVTLLCLGTGAVVLTRRGRREQPAIG